MSPKGILVIVILLLISFPVGNGYGMIGGLSRNNELQNAFPDRSRFKIRRLQDNTLQGGQHFCSSVPSELL